MIRFEGYRSKKTMCHVANIGFKFFIPLGCIFMIPCIFIVIYCNDTFDKIIWCVAFAFLGIVGCISPLSVFEKKWSYLQFEIDQEYFDGSYGIGETDNIKKVIDYGNCYKLVRNLKTGCIIQKDLLVEGTIEEFEELFQDKIVRKQER